MPSTLPSWPMRGKGTKPEDHNIAHCVRIAATDNDPVLKTVAYLHVFVEKGTGGMQTSFVPKGSPCRRFLRSVRYRAGKPKRKAYLARIMRNSLASRVKLADLRNNMMQAIRSGENAEKYRAGIALLMGLAGANTKASSGDAAPETAT